MLLAEELALVAIDPDSGRRAITTHASLNACLASLLVAELALDDRAATGSPTLAAAASVVEAKGPKLKAVLSHMNRGLKERVGLGTWDAVVAGLTGAGVVGPATGGLVPGHPLRDAGERDVIVTRLRAAAADDGPIEPRTALVLSMTGPADLLEVVAPERATRRHARTRIDHALDGSDLEPFGKVVRRLIQEAAA